MKYQNLPMGKQAPEIINVMIEISQGEHNKYEYDEEMGVLKLDRVLHSPFYYPTDYGFIPQTLSPDGDTLDCLVLTSCPVRPNCLVEARPVALLKMIDNGDKDYKVLAVSINDPYYKNITDVKQIPEQRLKEISHFFSEYKKLEGKTVKVVGWASKTEAFKVIRQAQEKFKNA